MGLVDQEKLDKIFAAGNTIRDLLPELAIVFPPTAVVDGVLLGAIPLIEEVISLIFQGAAIAQTYTDSAAAQDTLRDWVQAKAQAALDAKFPPGGET